jgi:hypothetical protein
MISLEDRQYTALIINEVVAAGCGLWCGGIQTGKKSKPGSLERADSKLG